MQQNEDGEVRLFRLFGRFSLSIAFITTLLYGESFADFKRVQSESFSNFRDKKDTEFSHYIQQQWQEYKAQYTQAMYKKAKPSAIIPAAHKSFTPVGPKIALEIIKPLKHAEEKSPRLAFVKKELNFEFFGAMLGFDIPTKMKKAKFYPSNQHGIVNFFSVMASSDYESLLYEINQVQKRLGLNDWGVALLVQKIAQQLFLNTDDAVLFRWFVLNKLHYDVRVALSHHHTLLLQSSKEIIYATPNYTLGKKKYYLIDKYNKESVGSIYTYEQDYPEANKKLEFALKTLPDLPQKRVQKKLHYKDFEKQYTISYTLNKNMIDFMATYPQVDYQIYFNAPMEAQTYQELSESLRKYIDGKKASEAINILLHFVQKAFVYETDAQQFGREKVMFAEETLYYANSDCEDRAILFAYLVKKLLGIAVVGVKYTNHMATALYIPLQGDSVKVGRKRFIIADPTYINANVGEGMQRYKSIIPEKFIYVKG